MYIEFHTNGDIARKGFHAKIVESMYTYQRFQFLGSLNQQENISIVIIHQLPNTYIVDMCRFWLNKSAGTLTSPHYGQYQYYGHNLNCTWMIDVQDGFYINIEITSFRVKSFKKWL